MISVIENFQLHYEIMGLPLYMQIVIEQNIILWSVTNIGPHNSGYKDSSSSL